MQQTHKEMALSFLSALLCPPSYACLLVLVLLLHAPTASSLSFSFNFSTSDYASQLNYSNDSRWAKPVIDLNKDSYDQGINGSVGRVSYAQPVPLWDRATHELASFDTTFSFQIKSGGNSDGGWPGDGMAFFLSYFPSVTPANSDGGNLGLFSRDITTNATGDEQVVAVEFDTFATPSLDEESSNHVGIDVNSIISVASKDTGNLSSGLPMTATVTYDNDTMLLSVRLQTADASYHISKNVDLRDLLPETVAVGFSAATGNCVELHQLLSWSFNSSDLETTKKSPSPRPEIIATAAAAAPDQAHEANNNNKAPHKLHLTPERIALVVVAALLVLAIACNFTRISHWCQQKRRRARGKRCCGPRRYQYSELVRATNRFDQQRKLGVGGSGEVYRGDDKGRLVAVKKLISNGTTDVEAQRTRKEFQAEVDIISRLRHKNLVRLFGWCDSSKGLILVYELISGGSLDKYLYDAERPFTWNDRYRVIVGLGKALVYLHGEHSGTKYVVHGDIKPSNIMLDEELNTRLGDFGLARLVDQGAEPLTTQIVMGTHGYIEPEFKETRKRSKESDVYSFGIVLLEMVTGHGPLIQPRARVWELYAQNRVLDAANPTLRASSEHNDLQMERVLIVGLWCTQPRTERPPIAQAMAALEHADAQLPVLRSCHAQLTATLASLGVESAGQSRVGSPVLAELAIVPSEIYTNTAPVAIASTTEPAYSSGMITAESSSTALLASSGRSTCSYTTCSVSAPATTSLGVDQATIRGNM